MSTIANAVFSHSSDDDDENDSDFVPDIKSDGEDENDEMTRPHVEAKTKVEASIHKQNRAALWASFETSAQGASTAYGEPKASQPKLVKIEKRYKFAGESIVEVVEVPEDSDDAKKWPLAGQSPIGSTSQGISASAGEPENPIVQPEISVEGLQKAASRAPSTSSNAPSPSGSQPASSTNTPVVESPKRPTRRPGPRKPKTLLMPLPSQGKAKKLTTLEKSAMDWQAHVQSTASSESVTSAGVGESISDELERNRRGGGYLEKMGFLDRVGQRRDELFEDSRSKRRKT